MLEMPFLGAGGLRVHQFAEEITEDDIRESSVEGPLNLMRKPNSLYLQL